MTNYNSFKMAKGYSLNFKRIHLKIEVVFAAVCVTISSDIMFLVQEYNISLPLSANFTKGNNFSDFLFAFLDNCDSNINPSKV